MDQKSKTPAKAQPHVVEASDEVKEVKKLRVEFLQLFGDWMLGNFQGFLVGVLLGVVLTLASGAHVVFGK